MSENKPNQVPQPVIDFAVDFAGVCEDHGLDRASVKVTFGFDTKMDHTISNEIEVKFNGVDARGRPNIVCTIEQRLHERVELPEICPNCETALPEGCAGEFSDEPQCRWQGVVETKPGEL